MRQLTYDSIYIGGEFVECNSTEPLIRNSALAEKEIGQMTLALSTYVNLAVAAACDVFASDEDGSRHR